MTSHAELRDALDRAGSVSGAARALGIPRTTLRNRLANSSIGSPSGVYATSTLYDSDGQPKLQWVKEKADSAHSEQVFREFIAGLVKPIKGKAPVVAAPKHCNTDLLAVYPLGDPHFGMYAWAEETGDDFDTHLAEKLTCAAIDRLVASAPPAETAIVLPLGDLIHADNTTSRTPQSGATLDVDTRWAKVMQIALRAMIYTVQQALTKHKQVTVRIVKGNHDPHASIGIALAIDAYFHGNKRVHVDLHPAAHWYYQFGKVLIGSTHGDTTKERDLMGVMAADKPKEWGNTLHRYWYCGHIHHTASKEYPGVVVEYFRTLATKDAWHAGQGYRSGRDMCCIVHHREYGEIERHRVDVGMLQDGKP